MSDNLQGRKPDDGEGKNLHKGRPLLALVLVVAVIGFFYVRSTRETVKAMPYSDFRALVDDADKRPTALTIVDGRTIEWSGADGARCRAVIPSDDPTLLPALTRNGVRVSGVVSGRGWLGVVVDALPYALLIVFFVLMLHGAQGAGPGSRALAFGKSRAHLYEDKDHKITFADVAGQKDAKQELEEIVEFLKDPDKFTAMGAHIPKGVLLVGMPGTGKTLMARAVAGEAGVDYFSMSGSDFVEMFVGVGASRVRDLFEQGRKHSPCIIFIDELDAVGRTRGAGYGGGHDEREQTLNQMLVEMDGFESKEGVIVLAATNRPDVLDPALLRPGRFDRQVVIAMPDLNEREELLRVHVQKVKVDTDVDLPRLARATPGMSGADIANLVNEAALRAARCDKKTVCMEDFDAARDKILMGVARSTLAISERERRMTAVHEAGHALLHYFLPHSDPLHKVTIVPHGRALGMAVSLPRDDIFSHTRSYLFDRIAICYGGYVAEKLIYGETTTGTQQDLKQATKMAHDMAFEWGMADDIGPISFGADDEPIFIGKEIARHKDYSDETAQRLDMAVAHILGEAREAAERILRDNRDKLEALSTALLERETLQDADVRELLALK
jgi:cell division protease FtsH